MMESDPLSESYSQCPRIQVKDSTNIGNANFRPDLNPRANCSVSSNFKVLQQNGINANCLVDKLSQNISNYIKVSDSNVKNFFGFKSSVCTDQIGSDIDKQLRERIMAKCQGKNPAHVVPIQQIIVPTCHLRVVQGATDLSACMINSMEQLIVDIYNHEKEYLMKKNLHTSIWIGLFIIGIIITIMFSIYVAK